MDAVKIIDQALRDFFSGKITLHDFTEIIKPFHDVDLTMALRIVNDQPEAVTRCKDCKHRPKIAEVPFCKDGGFIYELPDDVCPCQCYDQYYSWMPDDDWYCAKGERK